MGPENVCLTSSQVILVENIHDPIQFVCHKLIFHSPKGECLLLFPRQFTSAVLTNSEILLGETKMMKELEIRQCKK